MGEHKIFWSNGTMRLPNGPSGLGLIAYKYMIQWVAQPLKLLDECAQRYGDPFTLGLVGPFPKTVFFSSPQAIQQIFTATPEQVDTGRSNSILKPVGRTWDTGVRGEAFYTRCSKSTHYCMLRFKNAASNSILPGRIS